jgi:hypothetical protein
MAIPCASLRKEQKETSGVPGEAGAQDNILARLYRSAAIRRFGETAAIGQTLADYPFRHAPVRQRAAAFGEWRRGVKLISGIDLGSIRTPSGGRRNGPVQGPFRAAGYNSLGNAIGCLNSPSVKRITCRAIRGASGEISLTSVKARLILARSSKPCWQIGRFLKPTMASPHGGSLLRLGIRRRVTGRSAVDRCW